MHSLSDALPILFPMSVALNINPLFYGVLSNIAAGARQVTPPVGVGLYTAAATAGTRTQEVLKECLPFFAIWVIMGFVFIFFPDIFTWLPDLMSGK